MTAEATMTVTDLSQRSVPRHRAERIAVILSIILSAACITGYFLPWYTYIPTPSDQTLTAVSGWSLAFTPFQTNNTTTASAIAECLFILAPLLMAGLICGVSIFALWRPVWLGAHSLSVAAAIINAISFTDIHAYVQVYSVPFALFTGGKSPLTLLALLVVGDLLVITTILSAAFATRSARLARAAKLSAPALCAILGGALQIAAFFTPAFYGQARLLIYGNLEVDSSWVELQKLLALKGNAPYPIFDLVATLLLPLVISALACGVGVWLIFRKPGAISIALYALPVFVCLTNPVIGDFIILLLRSHPQDYPVNLGFADSLNIGGHLLIIAGGVALALRAWRERQAPATTISRNEEDAALV